MEIRKTDQVRGTVYDLPHAMSLASDDCNVLVCSTRTLYFIQAYGRGEVGFRSRYASEFLPNGRYVIAGDATDIDDINDIENNYELEVVDMSCDLVAALSEITSALVALNAAGCDTCGSEIEQEGLPLPDIGPGEPFETQAEYDTYKCEAANWLMDGLEDIVNKLKLYDVDFWAQTTVSAGSGLITAIILTTLIGGFVAVVAGAVIALITALIIGGTIDLFDIASELASARQVLVCALFDGSSADNSRTAFMDALASDTSLNAAEIALIGLVMTTNVVNNLYEKNAAIEGHTETTPCDVCECDTPEFQFDDGSVTSGVANVEGVDFTVTSAETAGTHYIVFWLNPQGSCPCKDYNIEVVSTGGPIGGVGAGNIADCSSTDVWRYNDQGYGALVDTWLARFVLLAGTGEFTVVFNITRP